MSIGPTTIGKRVRGKKVVTHTTICLRPSRGLRMNLRVRRVTGASESAIFATVEGVSLEIDG